MFIIGADEVGTGAIAGPAIVCCVRVPIDWKPPKGLRDSKKMTPLLRSKVSALLKKDSRLRYRRRFLTTKEIDTSSIQVLCKAAMTTLIHELGRHHWKKVKRIIVDGNYDIKDIYGIKVEAIPKADDNFPAVSAASVIAKVARDIHMGGAYRTYPEYGFAKHKGYATEAHREAIEEHGYVEGIHRTKNGKLWGY